MAKTPAGVLSLKQAAFVAALIADPYANGSAAAARAGYSRRYAADAAHRLIRNPLVKAAIDSARGELMAQGKYSAEVAMADLRRAEAFAVKTENATALMRCHELMMRLHGLLIDKAQIQLERVDLGGTLIEARRRAYPALAEFHEVPNNPFDD